MGVVAEAEKFDPVDLRVTYMPNMGSASLAVTARDKGVKFAGNEDYLDQVTFPSSFITTQKFADTNKCKGVDSAVEGTVYSFSIEVKN